ncbi:tryptophan 2,3-dioxygenase-like [Oscarella lobularis]|uniref:tryptophan 2,3-dioxygenase-like n=1 Tax=Oscarella lobularis TaxID=121494 RepID=UPI0033130BA7
MASPCDPGKSSDGDPDLHYLDYLKILELIDLQKPRSDAHDEHLFILIHQVYELWFKQVLHEIDSIMNIMSAEPETIKSSEMFLVNLRAQRIIVIQKILIDQIKVLETLTPLDFLDFRHRLSNSSGFESHQFRLIEVKLGVPNKWRKKEGSWEEIEKKFTRHPKQAKQLAEAVKKPSLLALVDRWLASTPGIDGKFQFFKKYCQTVENNISEEEAKAKEESDPKIKSEKLRRCDDKKKMHKMLTDSEEHEQLVEEGKRRFSHKAIQGALMISLYRDEPRFQSAYQFISLLTEIDSLLMQWRHNHSLFVHRMLGDKMGTGGTGYRYLHETVSEKYRIFLDFFNLSSYIIPRWHRPELSQEMKDHLAVHFTNPDEEREFAKRRLQDTE